MALVNCSKCNREISEYLDKCPYCNTIVSNGKGNSYSILKRAQLKMELWKWLIAISFIGVVACYVIVMSDIFEEGSSQIRVVILGMILLLTIGIVGIFQHKNAKADSLGITVDEYNRREQEKLDIWKEEVKKSKLPKIDDNGNIMCPKCGSSNIQLVNRKWSPVTGFMTNKVDRACINCKYKF